MKKKQNRKKIDKSVSLLLSIILVFCILGAVVFSVARKISAQMSDSAIQNLTESLDLIKSTIEAIFDKEAEFQKPRKLAVCLSQILFFVDVSRMSS